MADGNTSPIRPFGSIRTHHNPLVQPFLKWAGGKRQLLPEIKKFLPREKFNRYFEPFVGAGAVVLELQHRKVVINDFNAELVNCYQVIKDKPAALIKLSKIYQEKHSKPFFLGLRELDRTPSFKQLSDVQRAARIIYLNKTCFNGLFRVNSQGQFNVPFGDYENPRIVDEPLIRAVSEYLNKAQVEIKQGDFADAVKKAKKNDFIYLDPPYDPVSDTASFTGYSLNSFGKNEQIRLRDLCDDLSDRGCKILLSNSSTQFIKDLYAGPRYEIVEVSANRNINAVGSGRAKISELLIYNKYAPKGLQER